ncbi:MAG TPA: CerR family C-terminal domain-containing protein [Bryobacteraceae bacterium]|jgi:AcrR family transcriptional regulator
MALKSQMLRRPSSPEDELTRTRLLEAAGPIFAAEGFYGAKIRDICGQAGANVAAVNYYFGDKLGLYKEVLRYSLCAAPLDPVLEAGSPKLKLRALIRMILKSVFNAERPSWHMKLVLHEMSYPSPALDDLIEEFLRPRYDILCSLIGGMIGQAADSRLTQLCAHSVVGQARHYVIANAVIAKVWRGFTFNEREIDQLTEHILTFSLAGIRACSRSKQPAKKGPARG